MVIGRRHGGKTCSTAHRDPPSPRHTPPGSARLRLPRPARPALLQGQRAAEQRGDGGPQFRCAAIGGAGGTGSRPVADPPLWLVQAAS